MRRRTVLAVLIVLAATAPAGAVIMALTPLAGVLEQSTHIVVAKVEAVDADKLTMVLTVDEQLKGKLKHTRLPVNLKGDAEAAKGKQTPQLLKRLAPKLRIVLFLVEKDDGFNAFAYTEGTWFQMTGTDADGKVVWAFAHLEPYLRRTFKGTTAEMKQTVVDGLAGKKKPPDVDAKEKPGLGPEIAEPKKCGCVEEGPVFGVIPTVAIGAPMAVLALLFPAVFGGLILVLRRWTVALSVVSINTTLLLLHDWFGVYLLGTWWGGPAAVWLAMSVVTLLGLLWAWRRHLGTLTEPPPADPEALAEAALAVFRSEEDSPVQPTVPLLPLPDVDYRPGKGEAITLSVLSIVSVALLAWLAPLSADMNLWAKLLWTMAGGLVAATCYVLGRLWVFPATGRPGLPPEGVLIWAMLLASVGCFVTLTDRVAAPLTEDQEGVRVVWRFQPRTPCWIASSPVVAGDSVYIAAVHGALVRSGAVYALDEATGKVRWTFTDNGTMKDVFSSPAVANGRLYIGEGFHQDAGCRLFCLDAATGKKLWDFTTLSHTESTPCIHAGKVYFGAGDDGLFCLDAVTGEEVWHLTELHVDAGPVVEGGRVYCGSGVGDIYRETCLFCLDAATGKQVWRMPTDLPAWGGVVVKDGFVYAGIGNGNYLESDPRPTGAVLCLKAKDGERVWRTDARDGVLGRVAVDRQNVYFGSRDEHFYCLGRQDGAVKWKEKFDSAVVASPALIESGTDLGSSGVVVAGSDGLVKYLDTEMGRELWSFDVNKDTKQDAALFSSPGVRVLRQDQKGERLRVYVGGGLSQFQRGILYCLEANGKHGD